MSLQKRFDNLNFASLQSNIDFLKLQKFVNLGKIRIFYPNFVWLEMFCFVLGLGKVIESNEQELGQSEGKSRS